MGTMIRTRPRGMRAAVILGANEGVLPLSPETEGLFSIDEKKYFREKGFAIGGLDEVRMDEENAAMYRMMARPSEKIYISYAMTDTGGKDASPSPVIQTLKTLFPAIEAGGLIKKDIISGGWDAAMKDGQAGVINTAGDGMRHLINHIKSLGSSDPDSLTRAMLRWYADNRSDEISAMLKAARYDNDPAPIPRGKAKELFGRSDGTLVLSASSIGSYMDCPFRFFVERGLKPEEERAFASDPRSVGDIYHECLMAVARQIMGDAGLREKLRGSSGSSPDTEELERLVNETLDDLSQNYRGGLFISAGKEEYRMSRIREICAAAAEAMASQLAAESVTDAVFEEGFGRQKRFEPIKLTVGGDEVYVEGKIDRADMIDTDGTGRVRIIDYKTGSDKLDLWKMRNGYKMQLMIYMISAATGGPEPAGMFYFNIKDPIGSANDKTADQIGNLTERDAADEFKLKGVYINEEGVLDAMPVKVLSSAKNGISREEYEEVRSDVLARIEETASGILGGKIKINPLKNDDRLVCSYCGYRSVCRRDRGYVKNSARSIPNKKK